MIIHFITGGDIYSYNYINYVKRNFDVSQNKFFVYKNKNYNENYTTDYPNLEYYNKEIQFSIKKYKEIHKANKIVLHQLNIPLVVLFWVIFYPFIYNKLMWVIWGADLYDYYEKKVRLKDYLIEYLRSYFIRRVKYISCYIEGDYYLCRKIYGSKAKYFKSCYPKTIDEKIISYAHDNQIENQDTTILIGNSADKRNNHIDILNKLQRFKDENVRLLLILSYGGTKDYVEKVKNHALNLFGSKAVCILDYMSFETYAELLTKTNICIFGHKRQQGLGTINLMLAMKKKVFLNSFITPFVYFNNIGIKIYETDKIDIYSFAELIDISENDLAENQSKILEDLSLVKTNKYWEAILEKDWD